ncbi:MAG: shikimate dehydrogenase [Proteobacteria bacterium]|nr:shikimate dehydrogenase [Pseudomonadota bacterium]
MNSPDRYVVFGNPVAHSQSPFIHAEFARQTGEALVYERVLCPLDGFRAALAALAASGARGCNITVPFKFDAYAAATRTTARARLAGAANVLRFDADGWLGDNTDGAGLMADIERNAGVGIAGRRVLLIGAGGAAAGVLGPLLAHGPAEVAVTNRTAARADELVARHLEAAVAAHARLHAVPLAAPGLAYDIVLNASASSLEGAPAPVPASVLRPGTLALDLMYGPGAQAFVDWADAHAAVGRDGLGMLVEQAAEAFLLWRGVRPDTGPVLTLLHERLAVPR